MCDLTNTECRCLGRDDGRWELARLPVVLAHLLHVPYRSLKTHTCSNPHHHHFSLRIELYRTRLIFQGHHGTMPSKYSYAMVLADLENRGLIDAGHRPWPPGSNSPSSAQGRSPVEATEGSWIFAEQPAPITPQKPLQVLGQERSLVTSRGRSLIRATQHSTTPPRGRSPVKAPYGSPREPERPSSTAQPASAILHLPEPISDSRAATPTPTLPTRRSSAPPIPRRSSLRQSVIHSRNSSVTESFTSLSTTSSSSRAASSVITEIYAPLQRPSPPRLEHHPASLNTTFALQPSPLFLGHTSRLSQQTIHSASNSSSTPRSYTTIAKASNSSPASTFSEAFAKDDEPYFGSDEGDSESLSSLSSFSTLDYATKPWEDPRLYPDLYRFKPPTTPDSYSTRLTYSPAIEDSDSRSSSSISRFSLFSRQRGSSPDDAAPPPIARTRHVAFALPPKDTPVTRVTNRLSKLRPSLSLSRRPLSHIGHTKAPSPVTFVPFVNASHESLPISTESRDDSHFAFNWQASVFDIAEMSEAEQERLKKKGINPRLKAEMEAARKGRWLGPLVGNTFIG